MTDVPLEFPPRWGLKIIEPVANTGLAKLWKVQTADGTLAVLKLYRRSDRGNEAPAAQILTHWRDRGGVEIIAEAGNAVLMEWLEGPSLGDIARRGDAESACRSLAEAARRLHAKPWIQPIGLLDLNEVFAPLFQFDFSLNCSDPLKYNMMRAMGLARSLLDRQDNQVPLHGDLHHDNVIQTQHGLKVIDAKGYVGDPAFELANALRHPADMPMLVRQPEQIRWCLKLYSQAMEVQPKRLAQWAAAKCALSIFWRGKGTITDDPEADLLDQFLKVAD